MQEVLKNCRQTVDNEPGKSQVKGLNTESLIDVVRALTETLDALPTTTNLHVLFFGITYVRNAIGLAMEEGNKRLATETGGQG